VNSNTSRKSNKALLTKSFLLISLTIILAAFFAINDFTEKITSESLKEIKKNKYPLNEQEINYLKEVSQKVGFPSEKGYGDSPEVTRRELIQLLTIQDNRYQTCINEAFSLLQKKDPSRKLIKKLKSACTKRLTAIKLEDLKEKPFQRIEVKKYKKNLKSIKPTSDIYYHEIRNKTSETLEGPILYNDFLWTNSDAISSYINRKSRTETEKAIAAWNFLAKNYTKISPLSVPEEEHELMKYLAIYGYGICDDSARNFA